jgi:chromosomal replication initiator protein
MITAEQDYARIWQAVLEDLRGSTTPSIYEQRLKGTRCIGLRDKVLTVAVPNENDLHFLKNRIARHVQHAMVAVGAHHLQVDYVVADPSGGFDRMAGEVQRDHGQGTNGRPLGMAPLFGTGAPSVRDRYTFETFIVGKNNELAHAAALGVAEEPGRKYNPLFIWGTVGLGKTHLLHAIANRVKRKFPTMQVHYTSSETFVNDMIAAIREGRNESYERFHNRYRHVDVLLIDDIQFISGKEGTQEEFFHTFNALHGAEKQIVLTSDRAPQAMTLLEERLRSRFAGGLIADIQMPDYETRVAILRTWAEQQTIPVPANVVDFVARRVQNSVRQMEGTLKTILQKADVLKVGVTIDLAESVLEGMGAGRKRRQVTLQDVLNAVSQHYKVDLAALTGKQRDKAIALPRHVAMYLMREETGASLPAIGHFIGGRDHTTVMHGCEKIGRELDQENLPLRKDVLAVRGLLYEMQ